MGILQPENITRKVDNLGRITLPKGLRKRMYGNDGSVELEIFTAIIDGRQCICLSSPVDEKTRLRAAAEIFSECGVELTEEMRQHLGVDNEMGRM